MRYGYAWASLQEQTMDEQLAAIAEQDVDETYEEMGETRPQLRALLARLKAGDTLVIWRLDRLGMTVKQLLALIEDLDNKGITLISIKDNPDLNTLLALITMEREVIAERTKIGMADSNRGRPPKDDEEVEMAVRMYFANRPLKEIKEVTGLSKSTLYSYLRKLSGGDDRWRKQKRKTKSSNSPKNLSKE